MPPYPAQGGIVAFDRIEAIRVDEVAPFRLFAATP
jgi:hypothetical protein